MTTGPIRLFLLLLFLAFSAAPFLPLLTGPGLIDALPALVWGWVGIAAAAGWVLTGLPRISPLRAGQVLTASAALAWLQLCWTWASLFTCSAGLALIPFVGLAGLWLTVGATLWIVGVRQSRWKSSTVIRQMDGRCRNCGYNLMGLSEPRCPECGEPFDEGILVHFQPRHDRRVTND